MIGDEDVLVTYKFSGGETRVSLRASSSEEASRPWGIIDNYSAGYGGKIDSSIDLS